MLAVDPSSPFTGGAILGDRVRMQDHATDPGVFIRSMATRGHLGGLALATPEAIRLLDALGHRWIVVETVGVGQVEVEVAGKADTTVVVVNPGWGDSVQAAKAGLLEVADVFAINKADRAGVDATRRDLHQMLELAAETAAPASSSWTVPIIGDRRHRRHRRGRAVGRRVHPPVPHDRVGRARPSSTLPSRRGAARDRRPPTRGAGTRDLHRRPVGRHHRRGPGGRPRSLVGCRPHVGGAARPTRRRVTSPDTRGFPHGAGGTSGEEGHVRLR